jgi:chromosome segregation ATPase
MNSVQENKNELEAAVRYCESAISRAKATIESMEFRQQAATKAWREQTGREEALQREVAELHKIRKELEERINELMLKDEERNINMALMTDEIATLEQSEHDLKQANMGLVCDNDDLKDEITDLKVKQQTMEQTMQLQKDQIAMFQRKMSRLNEVNR